MDDTRCIANGTSNPVGQRHEVYSFAAQVCNDEILIRVHREVCATRWLDFLIVNTAGAARYIVGRAKFAVGVVDAISLPNLHRAFACGKSPVEGSARLIELPEGLESFPVQF